MALLRGADNTKESGGATGGRACLVCLNMLDWKGGLIPMAEVGLEGLGLWLSKAW